MRRTLLICLFVTATAAACSKPAPAPEKAETAGDTTPTELAGLPEELRGRVDKAFTGDLDGLIERRIIRAGVPFNRTFYFIDKGQPRGLSYEYMTLFEQKLNEKLNSGPLKVNVVLLPMPRDALLPALREGKVDLVAAQLTVTPERQKLVDFTMPTRTGISEVVVTGPGSPRLASLDDLSGKRLFVRRSSSYHDSVEALNRQLKAKGKAPVEIDDAPESLEDDDLLEMVNAGLVPAVVVDDFLANYWKQVFPKLEIHPDLALRRNGNLAVAIRKNSPKLAAELNSFIGEYGLDSVTGRVINQRYLQNADYVTSAASAAERDKFLQLVELFQKYGDQYSFDYLLMAAQGYQESHLDQNAKSHVGAIGVMQLMPETGSEQAVGDIHQIEPNIHAGVKYMRFMRDRYFEGEPMSALDKGLFTFASYNAGPGRIRQLRREASERGLNPNVWFGNVDRVASERIGRETVDYVSNIYKYYIAYRLIVADRERRAAARAALAKRAK